MGVKMGIEDKVINNLRYLGASVVSNAKSGHTGIVLGATPILYSLYSKQMNVCPTRANSIFRDRFVLSAGHGSAMLYSVLHAFGFPITKQDLMNFRKLDNPKVAGHPELNEQCGIDCSTGPLGQGVATAVGIALGQKMLEARFNKAGDKLFDAKTFALVGEGCLMEGVSSEALSLAGTLNLNNLIIIYDRNQVSLDSSTNLTFDIDIKAVMKAYGFAVFEVLDGNDIQEINQKISMAKKSQSPSFVVVNTRIGFKSEYENSNKAHGLVMKPEELIALKKKLKIESEDNFELDKDVQLQLAILKGRFNAIESDFDAKMKHLKMKYPKDFENITSMSLRTPISFSEHDLSSLKGKSSREMGGEILNQLALADFRIVGGTADVSSSTKAFIKDSQIVGKNNFSGRNILYGIREFAMACISNGLALMGFKAFASTFFVFSDYMRSAVRMSSLMKLPVVYILTHDSIAVGEDGPTHEPIEQLASFRAMPNLNVFRPCNERECFEAYRTAFSEVSTPSLIILTRQQLRALEGIEYDNMDKGAYIISKEGKGVLDGIIIATGSEVYLALEAKEKLAAKKINVRVVSMLNTNKFDEQSDSYKKNLLCSKNIVAIEAGSENGLCKYVNNINGVIGINTFGESGNAEMLFKKFNITSDEIVNRLRAIIKTNK